MMDIFKQITEHTKTIKDEQARMNKETGDTQQRHWETTFSQKDDMFGDGPSEPARKAVEVFKNEGKSMILELGAGQGRDTIFFAQANFRVCALDYSQPGIDAIDEKARRLGFTQSITTKCHDIREPLPFDDGSFDGCFSHMLYCMALATSELEFLSDEIRRVLGPGGLNIYTARHTGDAHFGTGVHHGEDLWEVAGFIVHFFNREKVLHLAKGFEIVGIDELEEGKLPRKLFQVSLRKESQ